MQLYAKQNQYYALYLDISCLDIKWRQLADIDTFYIIPPCDGNEACSYPDNAVSSVRIEVRSLAPQACVQTTALPCPTLDYLWPYLHREN